LPDDLDSLVERQEDKLAVRPAHHMPAERFLAPTFEVRL
jgi:hypothetical protein